MVFKTGRPPGRQGAAPDSSRRRLLQAASGAAAALALPWAGAQTPGRELSRASLRVASYKGDRATLLKAAGPAATPYRVEWKEFNSGVQQIEAINADALLALFRQRSHDDRILPIEDADIASHQEVARVFVQTGVLDGPVTVAPLWDRSLDRALRG